MSIQISCPHCDAQLRVKAEWAGRTATCKNCKRKFAIPAFESPVSSDPAPEVENIFHSISPHSEPPSRANAVEDVAAPHGVQNDRPNVPDNFHNERHDPLNVAQWRNEFRTVRWSRLIPFRNWLTDRPWTLLWVQFLSFAFGFPFLLIGHYRTDSSSLVEAAWAFGVYFSVIWAVLIHRCIRPERIGTSRIVGTWCFTSLLGVVAVLVVSEIGRFLPGISGVFKASESASVFDRLLGMTLAVGFIEESAKLAPVIWFATKMNPTPRPTTIAYIGVVSGLAFGATEAIMYSVSYAVGHASSHIGYGDYLIVQLLRLISLPFLHGIWTGISSYFVGLSRLTTTSRRAVIIVGLTGVSLLHGSYNTFGDGWLGFLIAMISLGIFIGYVRDESNAINAITTKPVE